MTTSTTLVNETGHRARVPEFDVAAKSTMDKLLTQLTRHGGSDLFLTHGMAPGMKIDGRMCSVAALAEPPSEMSSMDALTSERAGALVRSIMSQEQADQFAATHEAQFAIATHAGRFRVSAFVQQGHTGAVIRVIRTDIPQLESLGLPDITRDVVMSKRGLIIFCGATGSGKSTSLAALLGYRNAHSNGHIITIEDPIEFVHPHGGCMVTQREVGTDTASWENALTNTLRQAPDVILIGEVRTRETMEHALHFAETGHLVLCSTHANNANQALDRILNFFPTESQSQVLMDLSLNMRAIISQRLIARQHGGRCAALEVLLDTPLVKDLIRKGELGAIKDAMAHDTHSGMQTFDSQLFDLYERDLISFHDALSNADSANDLRLMIKLEGRRGLPSEENDSESRRGPDASDGTLDKEGATTDSDSKKSPGGLSLTPLS